MIRKVTVTLLAGVICLLGGTSALAAEYNEAPMLRARVAAGELPPVEERLPEDVLVLEPVGEKGEIGRYGGTIRLAHLLVVRSVEMSGLRNWATLLAISPEDYSTIVPNVAKGWELSKDGKTLTFYLRKGMKWSDGAPFTADDIMFWYEDVVLNDQLTPVKPKIWSPGGELMTVEKVDDYTVRWHFVVSYPTAELKLAGGYLVYLPKHYLKNYHPRYVPVEQLERMTEEAGYEEWWQLLRSKIRLNHYDLLGQVNAPVLAAYGITEVGANVTVLERNPYYWKVDREGNQLPYIDKIYLSLVNDREIKIMKIINGELDYARRNLEVKDFPLLTDNAEKGGYRVLHWIEPTSSLTEFQVNLTHKNPVLRKIFQDKRFRQALSLALNREEINEVVFYGLGKPRQNTVLPPSRFYKEEFVQAYAQYDPERANQLLDEMGLKWDDNHEYRLRPDGKRLVIVVEMWDRISYIPVSELAKEYWEAIGIQVVLKVEDHALWVIRIQANDHDMVAYHSELTELMVRTNPRDLTPMDTYACWAVAWNQWYLSMGKSGEEPPQSIKRLLDLWDVTQTSMDEEERASAIEELLRVNAENVWTIGTVGELPMWAVINENLANVPEKVTVYWDYRHDSIANPEVWFYKK